MRRALKHDPDLAEASSLLGTAYVRLGRYAEAVPVLRWENQRLPRKNWRVRMSYVSAIWSATKR